MPYAPSILEDKIKFFFNKKIFTPYMSFALKIKKNANLILASSELVLFILLISLIVIGIFNAYVFKSSRRRLLQSYFGVCLFTFYLIYDFNRLEKAIASGDTSWAVAVDIAVNIYLDIINLFIRLLEILAD